MRNDDTSYFVYILRCADNTVYVGSSTDSVGRVSAHNAGHGPRYTARRRPVQLVYAEQFPTMPEARRREIQLKRWSRARKEALIDGNLDRLHGLSRRKQR